MREMSWKIDIVVQTNDNISLTRVSKPSHHLKSKAYTNKIIKKGSDAHLKVKRRTHARIWQIDTEALTAALL